MPKSDVVASIGAWVLENGHRAILAMTGGRWPKTTPEALTTPWPPIGR